MLKALQICISLPKMTRLAWCENYSKPLSAPKLDSEKLGKERTSTSPEPSTIRSSQLHTAQAFGESNLMKISRRVVYLGKDGTSSISGSQAVSQVH